MRSARLAGGSLERRSTSKARLPQVLVHAGLQTLLCLLLDQLVSVGYSVAFAEAPGLAQQLDGELAALLLPASNEAELDLLRSLRPLCCLVPIAAVVSDAFGLHTYEAIRAGATSVVNLLLPVEAQLAAAKLHLPTGVYETGRREDAPTEAVSSAKVLGEHDALLRALCSGRPVTQLAKDFYCSERSMYRRIRGLYEELGVSSRAELRLKMAPYG